MNETIDTFARDTLKADLQKCTDGQQLLFKRMYAHKNLDRSIEWVVDHMESEKLDWAMQQVQRTLAKQAAKEESTDKINA